MKTFQPPRKNSGDFFCLRSVISRFWQKKGALLRFFISLCLLFHFGSLVLASLPWSPFVASVYPYYGWYIRATSQQQGWGMYQYPTQTDIRYEVVASMPDGSQVWPIGAPSEVAPRQLYVVEGILISHESYADQFMSYVRQQFPEGNQPTRMEMRYFKAPVAPLAVVKPDSGYRGSFEQQKHLVRSWE